MYYIKMARQPTEWRHLTHRPSAVDFRIIPLEEILIILWRSSTVLINDNIPTEKSFDEMFEMAKQKIIEAKPMEVELKNGPCIEERWYFKKWITDFYGKKIMSDFSDPRRMCSIWYDEINSKPDYMRSISSQALAKRFQRNKF